ncbi:MAG TPA: TlpA disulfide reductase family protein [Thermodesulfobacteriota bacterium]|nr:TlpA disulfide reductase family protein [Thermodesulfobacteriota bacterium]
MERNVFSRSLSLVLILLVAFVFTTEGGEGDLFSKIRIDPIKGDKKAPDFSLRDLNGHKVGIKQLKGKIVLLNFWTTWCGPCKEEMSSLEVLHQRFRERDFVLLTILLITKAQNTFRSSLINITIPSLCYSIPKVKPLTFME